MNPYANPPPLHGKPRRRFLPLILITAVLLPFLVLSAFYATYRWSNSSAIRRLKAQARQQGEPLSLVELAATYPPIPDDENGAVLLLQVWEKDQPNFWRAFRNGAQCLPDRRTAKLDPMLPLLGANAEDVKRGEPLDAESLRRAEAYLAQEKQHLLDVQAALRYSQFRFPLLITNGFATLLPHLGELKKEALNFELQAFVDSAHGDSDAAITALENAAHTGSPMANEPFLISHLVRIACYGIALNGMERLLSEDSLSGAQLDRLNALLHDLQMSGVVHKTFVAERAADLSVFEHPENFTLPDSGSKTDPETAQNEFRIAMRFFSAVGMKDADERLTLETFGHAIAFSDTNTPEALDECENSFAGTGVEARKFPPKLLSAMLLPALKNAPSRFAGFEGRRRAAITALAVERYRARHNGKLPEKLDELVPEFLAEVPTDPFDGEELRFKLLPKGFVVYSIGADRVDNGGKERPPNRAVRNFDETFIVER